MTQIARLAFVGLGLGLGLASAEFASAAPGAIPRAATPSTAQVSASRAPQALVHVVRPPLVPPAPGQKAPLLVMLHGLGADENDLMPLAGRFDPRFFVAGARAPYRLAGRGHTWFAVEILPDGRRLDPEQAEQSRTKIVAFIDEAVAAFGVDPARVYLCGFSQGAMLAESVLLTAPDKVAGIVALSGRLLPGIQTRAVLRRTPAARAALVAHGRRDRLVEFEESQRAIRVMRGRGIDVTEAAFDGGHEIPPATIEAAGRWLTARLERPEAGNARSPTSGRK